MNKENLDERQVSIRNKIGNQCFLLLAYMIFADVGLYGLGVRWLAYPMNIFVLLLACMFIYLIRLIACGSYAGPNTGKKKTYAVIAVIGIAMALGAVTYMLFKGNRASETVSAAEDNGGLILFIISAVMLVIVLTISIIKKGQNKGGDE